MAVPEFTTEELQSEEWRDCVGYEGFYQVSSLGRLKRINPRHARLRPGQVLRQSLSDGYPYANLSTGTNASHKRRHAHRLVAEAFLGPRPEGYEVNHIDLNRANNRASNLEYVTHRENIEHARRLGRIVVPRGPNPNRQGEKSVHAKLTANDVLAIRKDLANKVKGKILAEQYGVTAMTISLIKRGTNWKCLLPREQ